MTNRTATPQRPSAARPEEPVEVGSPAEAGEPVEALTMLKRDAAVPNRPSLKMSPLLSMMPSEIVESFHYLVARLQLSDDGLPSPIAIVAANHGEGVTTVTRALGAVLANDLDASVCIVDLSSPIPAERAEGTTTVGLFDVVDAEVPLSQALRTTADDRLMVLGSGIGSAAQARQLIRSPALAHVFGVLDGMFDYVLLDVPPILATSTGVAMLRHAKSCLMVVAHGRTTTDQVRAVSEEIASLNSIGVVMNHVSTRIPKKLRRFFAV
jgi:Mrp family chromosome partitioning ATPase